jgi:antitoxin component YwqK of YwqJK toxin-antitoxin module
MFLALACAMAVGLWLAARPPKKVPGEQLLRSQLTLRDGRWGRAGQATPFTGVLLEVYDSGRLKARSAISNGLPEGLSEGWYTNGQMQVREYFRLGLSHGLRMKWYCNGRKQSEVMTLAGKLEGTFRRWNEDGSLSEEIELKQGSPDGISRAYHPSGFLKTEVLLRNGQVLHRKTWSDGEHERTASTPNDSLATATN